MAEFFFFFGGGLNKKMSKKCNEPWHMIKRAFGKLELKMDRARSWRNITERSASRTERPGQSSPGKWRNQLGMEKMLLYKAPVYIWKFKDFLCMSSWLLYEQGAHGWRLRHGGQWRTEESHVSTFCIFSKVAYTKCCSFKSVTNINYCTPFF